MNYAELVEQIRSKRSYLCVGLDTDIKKIPEHLLDYQDPVFEFNKRIIEATQDVCVAYKPNIAFYEAQGPKGWESLAKTLAYIPKTHFSIADAKRGDIGNTSSLYARTFFETYDFDSITVAPYMGHDSVKPFLAFEDKWVILLGLTSNPGSSDFQFQALESGKLVYQQVLETAKSWSNESQLMFVVGATHPARFQDIRRILPKHFLLVPGVGAQGGDLEGLSDYGLTEDIGLLVNSTRGIIYASQGTDFAEVARQKALELQQAMASILEGKNLV
ncbi:MAG: orotidine-5'-phosphate decarboxylase [Bacteroidota bacterium]